MHILTSHTSHRPDHQSARINTEQRFKPAQNYKEVELDHVIGCGRNAQSTSTDNSAEIMPWADINQELSTHSSNHCQITYSHNKTLSALSTQIKIVHMQSSECLPPKRSIQDLCYKSIVHHKAQRAKYLWIREH